MPRKKQISDYCDDVAKRHGLSTTQRQKFHMYAKSLASRIEEAQYAWDEVKSLYDKPDLASTQALGTLGELMRYRCTVFWAMSYSVFDIFSNAANAVHRLRDNERSVSFNNIRTPDWDTAGTLLKETNRVKSRAYFRRLDSLRNCSLHRRSVNLEKHDIEIDAAYVLLDSTSPRSPRREWLVCDDPNETEPTSGKHIELLKECTKIMKGTTEDIVKLLKSI